MASWKDYRLPRSSRRNAWLPSPEVPISALDRSVPFSHSHSRSGRLVNRRDASVGELPVLSGQWSRWPARGASEDASHGTGQTSFRTSALFASYSCVLTGPSWNCASSFLGPSASRSTAEPACCTAGGERLIVNSPHEEPAWHWRYDRTAHLFDLADGHRPAGYSAAWHESSSADGSYSVSLNGPKRSFRSLKRRRSIGCTSTFRPTATRSSGSAPRWRPGPETQPSWPRSSQGKSSTG